MLLIIPVSLLLARVIAKNIDSPDMDMEHDYEKAERGLNNPLEEILKTATGVNNFFQFNENILLKEVLNGHNGTDSGMYNEDLYEGDIFLKDPEGKNAITYGQKLWPKGIVIFKIAEDVGCPDSRQCKIIMYAMDIYHKKTCLRFKEWTGERDFVEIFYNKGNSGACWSEVGRSGGQQRLSLGDRCWFVGIAVHELGHAIGFWHEMNRPDRDEHVIIHWRNILSGFTSSFIKNLPSMVNTLGEPFDLKSIMMYDEYAFSKDGRSPTIQSKSGTFIGPIWRKRGLSESDTRQIYKLYNCNGSNAHSGFPYNFKCDFNVNTCGFRNRGKVLWKWRPVPKARGYFFATGNQISSNTQLISVNLHPIEDINNNSFGCFYFSYYLSGSSAVKVKQEVLYSVTDVSKGFSRNLWMSNFTKEGWNNVQTSIDMRKPYRIGFEPFFNGHGVVAINNIKMTVEKCVFNHSKV